MIHIVSASRYKLDKKYLTKTSEQYLTKRGISPDLLLSLIFVGKRKMTEIASTYKHEDVALPVLSFSYKNEKENPDKLLGEVFLCYPQIVLLAAERNKTVDAMIEAMIEHGIENLLK